MLKEGDKAPSFKLTSDTGEHVSLRDFAGKTLVLYFYPRDNTPGCTRQAQAFTEAKSAFEAAGATVVGVSRDSLKSHQSFRAKCDLDIPLLSDPDLNVHRAYGAWGEKTMYGKKVEGVLRTTFLIENGKVRRVFPNVRVDGHADAVLSAIHALSAGHAVERRAPSASAAKAKTSATKAKTSATKAKTSAAKAPRKAAKTLSTKARQAKAAPAVKATRSAKAGKVTPRATSKKAAVKPTSTKGRRKG